MAFRVGAWCLVATAGVLAQDGIGNGRTTRTGAYMSSTSQTTHETSHLATSTDSISSTSAGNAKQSAANIATTSNTDTILTGSARIASTSLSRTISTALPSPPPPMNTQACNNYVEFCTRKYGNITEIACHNSPFITPNNIAANQQHDVTQQLNDGVRLLQAQMQWPDSSSEPHFCHTSCDVLDAGPITVWLTKVKNWVAQHPFDVVTILLGNGGHLKPSQYAPYIEQTGILRYAYTPPHVPMNLSSWPTLADMILSGGRVVFFMDYLANQTEYPWLLDEFSQMWETPFDPVDASFPCDAQRPPDLAPDDAGKMLSLINHNLNINFSLLGVDMLVPARTELNVTNNLTGAGSLGLGAENCLAQWGRAPSFLNVDYYNYGGSPGSVFEVAARLNNVTYNRKCCGVPLVAGAERPSSVGSGVLAGHIKTELISIQNSLQGKDIDDAILSSTFMTTAPDLDVALRKIALDIAQTLAQDIFERVKQTMAPDNVEEQEPPIDFTDKWISQP
ncbi:PLC-like phosphodiesterase [Nemania sp. NC0429]|nr:PLC-like phosphodiesterase [Nemania sp. NC0429]